jgi:formylglycine-generating enzyme required for sulfatase activity
VDDKPSRKGLTTNQVQLVGAIIGVIGVIIAALIGIVPPLLEQTANANATGTADSATRAALAVTNQTSAEITLPADAPSETPSITPTPEPTLTPTTTLEIAQIVATLDAQATIDQATLNVNNTAAARATEYAVGTQNSVDATNTATRWTATPTPNITASIEAFRTQQAQTATAQHLIDLTMTATLWTATPTPTLTPTPTPTPTITPTPDPYEEALGRAQAFSGSNGDWQTLYRNGFIYEFPEDGLPMVLVPAGCFTMGSTEEQIDYAMTLYDDRGSLFYADETPTTRVCFAEPFWMDLYEVTQSDFARLGGQAANDNYFDGDNRPRERITWYEARDFCDLRGARLPTEAEWEYTARGPDSLIYPWGNTFVGHTVVYGENSGGETAVVSSRPGGRSWVGAYDLSGNVWEWTSTLYMAYPYPIDSRGIVVDDGREDTNSTNIRVLRGGAWLVTESHVRASYRFEYNPSGRINGGGFRCARAVE